MADHVRRQLRAAVTTAVTGLATTSTRVYGYRVQPVQPAALPALSVRIVSEEAVAASMNAYPLVERAVQVRVLGMAQSTGVPDDTLDLIAKEVETALAAPLTVAGKSVQLVYRGCEIEFADGDRGIGTVELQYEALIFNRSNTPDVLA